MNEIQKRPIEAKDREAEKASAEDYGHVDEVLERLRSFLDNRTLAIVLLFSLLFVLVGLNDIVLFLILLLVGFLACDRFVTCAVALFWAALHGSR